MGMNITQVTELGAAFREYYPIATDLVTVEKRFSETGAEYPATEVQFWAGNTSIKVKVPNEMLLQCLRAQERAARLRVEELGGSI